MVLKLSRKIETVKSSQYLNPEVGNPSQRHSPTPMIYPNSVARNGKKKKENGMSKPTLVIILPNFEIRNN